MRFHLPSVAVLGLALALCPQDAFAAKPAALFKKALQRKNSAGMIAAAEKLAAAPSKKGTKVLALYGAMVPDAEVYRACRDALAKAYAHAKSKPVLEKLAQKAKAMEQRTLCVDALGASGDAGAVALLSKILSKDKDKTVRMGAIAALVQLKHRTCIPPLYQRLDKVGFKSADAEAEELYGALRRLTGRTKESRAEWDKWWKVKGKDFDPSAVGKPADAARTSSRKSSGKIFSSEVRSQAFVLVLDISSSMRVIDLMGKTWKDSKGKPHNYKDPDPRGAKPPHKDSRFRKAQNAFCKFIGGLSKKARFSIVVFGAKKDCRFWKKGLVRANKKVKADAIKFVKGLKWSGATRTDTALDLAFSVKGADSIYLFSDGIPEKRVSGKTKDIPQDKILEQVRALNRARKLRLHCYAMTSSPKTQAFLQKLAKENRGEYKDLRTAK